MWWGFGSGVAVGLVIGAVAAGLWLLPHLMRLLSQTIEASSRAIRYPSSDQVFTPLAPYQAVDPFADLNNDETQVPSWMEEIEEAT